MSERGTLYAWSLVSPVGTNLPFEHAWVTDYPFTNGEYPTAQVVPAGARIWYCWGLYHDSGDGGIHHLSNGAIGQVEADLALANALVQANTLPPDWHAGGPDTPPDGSIDYYAIDGVCHQVANQVLFASGTATQEPMRVNQIAAYHLSTFFYTNYGLNDAGWNALRERHAPHIVVPGDDFDAWFAQVVPAATPGQKDGVNAARTTAQQALRALASSDAPVDQKWADVKTIYQTAFGELGKILGPPAFAKLFPILSGVPPTPEHSAHWVDARMFARAAQRPARPC